MVDKTSCTHHGCILPATKSAKYDASIIGYFCDGHAEEIIKFLAWGDLEIKEMPCPQPPKSA